MEKRTLLFRDKQVTYTVSGSGTPVILLHGFGEDSFIWHQQVPALAALCKIIVPDIPGSGESELIPEAGIPVYAGVIKSIIEKEGQTALLIGHSMGGYIALELAQRYPEAVSALGLVHSTAYADSDERKVMRGKAMDFIRQKGAWTFLKASTPGLFAPDAQERLRHEIAELSERNRSFTEEAICQYYQAMLERPDRSDVLRHFHGPVFMVIGEEDPAVPFKQSLEQTHLPAEAHVHILRGVAHMGMWEEPRKMSELLVAFVTHCIHAQPSQSFNKK